MPTEKVRATSSGDIWDTCVCVFCVLCFTLYDLPGESDDNNGAVAYEDNDDWIVEWFGFGILELPGKCSASLHHPVHTLHINCAHNMFIPKRQRLRWAMQISIRSAHFGNVSILIVEWWIVFFLHLFRIHVGMWEAKRSRYMTNDVCETEHSPEIEVVWLASRNVQSRTARLKAQRKTQITKTKAAASLREHNETLRCLQNWWGSVVCWFSVRLLRVVPLLHTG